MLCTSISTYSRLGGAWHSGTSVRSVRASVTHATICFIYNSAASCDPHRNQPAPSRSASTMYRQTCTSQQFCNQRLWRHASKPHDTLRQHRMHALAQAREPSQRRPAVANYTSRQLLARFIAPAPLAQHARHATVESFKRSAYAVSDAYRSTSSFAALLRPRCAAPGSARKGTHPGFKASAATAGAGPPETSSACEGQSDASDDSGEEENSGEEDEGAEDDGDDSWEEGSCITGDEFPM